MKSTKQLLFLIVIITIMLVACSEKKTTEPEQFNLKTVTFRLSTSDGGSVVGAIVAILAEGSTGNPLQKTATGNIVEFTGVAIGTYTITITHSGYYTYSNNFTVNEEGNSHNITLNKADTSTITSVSVSPTTVNVNSGDTYTFTATVNGTNNPVQTVTWSVTGGISGTSINSSGVLNIAISEQAETVTVTATSTVDTNKSGTAKVNVMAKGNDYVITDIATWNQAINGIRNAGNNKSHTMTINNDLAVPTFIENLFGNLTGLSVLVQGSGTLSNSGGSGALFWMGSQQTLTLHNITLDGKGTNTTALVLSEGTLHMTGNATIKNNKKAGVVVSNMTMSDNSLITNNHDTGSMFGNSSTGGGANVGGNMLMEGNATISENSAGSKGGGLCVSGNFTMKGNAKIINNTLSGNASSIEGGGVYVGGTFDMESGTISGNSINVGLSSDVHGGGVYANVLNLMGGEIKDNTINGNRTNGGGAYVSGLCTMTSGSISGNRTNGGFGGGGLNTGRLIMNGGTITKNSSNDVGGGVFARNSVDIRNGTISNNTAVGHGGGVLISDLSSSFWSTFNMSGGIISGNKTGANGGGVMILDLPIYIDFKKTGGIIYGNDANESLKNVSTSDTGKGHAIHATDRWRGATAGENDFPEDYGFWTND